MQTPLTKVLEMEKYKEMVPRVLAQDGSYESRVNQLIKRGVNILPTLTPFKCELLHIALGMTEVLELIEGMHNADIKNVIEELGDLEFYTTELFTQLDLIRVANVTPNENHFNTESIDELINASGSVIDAIKKFVIYDNELKFDLIVSGAHAAGIALDRTIMLVGMTRCEIRDANMDKLGKRQPTGTYTNEAMIARADKADEEG